MRNPSRPVDRVAKGQETRFEGGPLWKRNGAYTRCVGRECCTMHLDPSEAVKQGARRDAQAALHRRVNGTDRRETR